MKKEQKNCSNFKTGKSVLKNTNLPFIQNENYCELKLFYISKNTNCAKHCIYFSPSEKAIKQQIEFNNKHSLIN